MIRLTLFSVISWKVLVGGSVGQYESLKTAVLYATNELGWSSRHLQEGLLSDVYSQC